MPKDTMENTNTETELDGNIKDTLHSLYGFNLGFVLEGRIKAGNISENVKQIQHDVAHLIHKSGKGGNRSMQEIKTDIVQTLTEEVLKEISKSREGYRQAVLNRLNDPAINF